jgi:PleD family two-component response regulator
VSLASYFSGMFRKKGESPMVEYKTMGFKTILLVEDNPDDELLTRRTLKKNNVCHEVVVAHDGVEALDYLFGTGTH